VLQAQATNSKKFHWSVTPVSHVIQQTLAFLYPDLLGLATPDTDAKMELVWFVTRGDTLLSLFTPSLPPTSSLGPAKKRDGAGLLSQNRFRRRLRGTGARKGGWVGQTRCAGIFIMSEKTLVNVESVHEDPCDHLSRFPEKGCSVSRRKSKTSFRGAF
jgi:hypothetical protein